VNSPLLPHAVLFGNPCISAVLLFTEASRWEVFLLELELFSLDWLHNRLSQRLRIFLLDQGLNTFSIDLLGRGIVLLVLVQYNLVLRDLCLHKYAVTKGHALLGQDSVAHTQSISACASTEQGLASNARQGSAGLGRVHFHVLILVLVAIGAASVLGSSHVLVLGLILVLVLNVVIGQIVAEVVAVFVVKGLVHDVAARSVLFFLWVVVGVLVQNSRENETAFGEGGRKGGRERDEWDGFDWMDCL